MTKVISFLNRKGGTGKTTSALYVATALRRMGFQEVTLMETDRNYSLATLKAMRQDNDDLESYPEIIQTRDADIVRIIGQLCQAMKDVVVVDGAANMSAASLRAIARSSNVIALPCSLSPAEILVTRMTVEDISEDALQAGAGMVLLPVRIHWFTQQRTIEAALSGIGVQLLPLYVPNFKQYTDLQRLTPGECYEMVTRELLRVMSRPVHQVQPVDSGTAVQVMKHYKTCVQCGEGFWAKSAKAEYCSTACRVAHHRQLVRV
ncbi:MAG: hypothetical protein KatS3mg031_0182 [Chitinophagales bacterium]|nr:MAG: hypothetical protein KatS3mg031_0182 [Chitinophagales bacterium]